MIEGKETKLDFERMFPIGELSGFGDGWFIQWRASQALRYEIYLAIMSLAIADTCPKEYLEIGCAQSNLLSKVRETFPSFRATGTDLSDNVIQWNTLKFPDVTYKQCALPDVGYDPDGFDVISAFEVIYYLDPGKQIDALKNIFLALKSGGTFFLSGGLDDGNRYWKEEWICQAVSQLFEIVRIEYQYAGCYARMEAPMLRLLTHSREVLRILDMSEEELSEHTHHRSATGRKWMRVIRVGIFQGIWQRLALAAITIAKYMLGWRWLPKLCSQATRLLFPRSGRSHIILVARKPDA